MKATTTNSVSFFSCTIPSSKNFNNWFSGNTTNFGSKSLSLDLNTINPEQKMFNGNCDPKHVRGELGRNNSWRT